MIVADLERANSRVVTVERRNVRLSLLLILVVSRLSVCRRSCFARKLRPSKAATKDLTGMIFPRLTFAHKSSPDDSMNGCRVKELEAKLSDLESETDRLSTALDAQKAATAEMRSNATKKVEELSRELQKKASFLVRMNEIYLRLLSLGHL